MNDLEEFTGACIEALYFTDTGPDCEDMNADAELSDETLADLKADCRSFWRRFGPFIMTEKCTCRRPSDEYTKAQMAGHDFWFSRNGHGAGFDDGDWSDNYATMLDEGAKGYGEFNTYLGDDGRIWA